MTMDKKQRYHINKAKYFNFKFGNLIDAKFFNNSLRFADSALWLMMITSLDYIYF